MVGLSATPFAAGMGKLWEGLVRPESMKESLRNGTISKYRIIACRKASRINTNNLKIDSTGEYTDRTVDKEVSRVVGDVYREWKDSVDMRGRKVLIFAQSISSCLALTDKFLSNGVRTGCIHSKMTEVEIQNAINSFKDGELEMLCSVKMLIEGFDHAEVSGILMCAPLAPSKSDPNIPNSPVSYLQMAGRGLRACEGKEYCLIHDHSGNSLRYGRYELIEELFHELSDEKRVKTQLTTEERKKRAIRECKICTSVVHGPKCPRCGHETHPPTKFLTAGDIVYEHGVMVDITTWNLDQTAKKRKARERGKAVEMTLGEKGMFAAMLKQFTENKVKAKKGKMKGEWYYNMKYKERTGHHPPPGQTYKEISPVKTNEKFRPYMQTTV